jgi:putative intracellular protease/amidase
MHFGEEFNATLCMASHDWSVIASEKSRFAWDDALTVGSRVVDGLQMRYFAFVDDDAQCTTFTRGSCYLFDTPQDSTKVRVLDATWRDCTKVGGLFRNQVARLVNIDKVSVHTETHVELGSDAYASEGPTVRCCHYTSSMKFHGYTLATQHVTSYPRCELSAFLGGERPALGKPRFDHQNALVIPMWDTAGECVPNIRDSDVDRFVCCSDISEPEDMATVRKIALGVNNRTYYTSMVVRARRCTMADSIMVTSFDASVKACKVIPPPPPTFKKDIETYWIYGQVLRDSGILEAQQVLAGRVYAVCGVLLLVFLGLLFMGCTVFKGFNQASQAHADAFRRDVDMGEEICAISVLLDTLVVEEEHPQGIRDDLAPQPAIVQDMSRESPSVELADPVSYSETYEDTQQGEHEDGEGQEPEEDPFVFDPSQGDTLDDDTDDGPPYIPGANAEWVYTDQVPMYIPYDNNGVTGTEDEEQESAV